MDEMDFADMIKQELNKRYYALFDHYFMCGDMELEACPRKEEHEKEGITFAERNKND